LLIELQACYCVGAWITVIILSISIIEAQLRETEAVDARIGTARLLDLYFGREKINWLRKLRNKYVHIDLQSPTICIDDQYNNREEMEADAKCAIRMVAQSFFQSPGV
jgi:hypothetical protein